MNLLIETRPDMDMYVYRFARLEDGINAVEKQAYELEMRRHRDGTLSPEELDWLDWANTIFQANSVAMQCTKLVAS
jgi:hypothetical protein